jgi:regulator of PEP synthase PpsR (kinase-PPPase family)
VLYTLVERDLSDRLEARCREIGCSCLSVLAPVFALFRGPLNAEQLARPGAQHVLDAEYFRRIDALNFSMLHDDGQLTEQLDEAEVVLVGVSRTSETPTSSYLANRGIKTANVPLVPNLPIPDELLRLQWPLVVGLIASPERIVQMRQNRLLALAGAMSSFDDPYVDRQAVSEEVAFSRRCFARHGWPIIDVTRRSIEETAAAILALHHVHVQKRSRLQ